jgi:hypothetical protein
VGFIPASLLEFGLVAGPSNPELPMRKATTMLAADLDSLRI